MPEVLKFRKENLVQVGVFLFLSLECGSQKCLFPIFPTPSSSCTHTCPCSHKTAAELLTLDLLSILSEKKDLKCTIYKILNVFHCLLNSPSQLCFYFLLPLSSEVIREAKSPPRALSPLVQNVMYCLNIFLKQMLRPHNIQENRLQASKTKIYEELEDMKRFSKERKGFPRSKGDDNRQSHPDQC